MKIRGKLSLNKMLHNDRAMIIFSLVAAVAIWAAVVYGPTSSMTRTISGLEIDRSLTNSVAESNGLRVIGKETMTASIVVEGPRWVVSKLKAEDIHVKADTSYILNSGSYNVSVSAVATDANAGYTIKSVTPDKITLNCDFWQEETPFTVEPDIASVKLADDLVKQKYQLGTAAMDTATLPDSQVRIEGPKSVMSRIAKVVARVKKGATIQEDTVFEAAIVALDEDGKDIDLSTCTLSAESVNVTVPVWLSQTVNFQYSLANVPQTLKNKKNFMTITPESIHLLGPGEAVKDYAASIEKRVIDFDNIKNTDTELTYKLTPPDNVQILGDVKEVTVKLDMPGMVSKTMDLTITDDNIRILNKPANATIRYDKIKLTGITIMGSSRSISRLKESDLTLVVDMQGEAVAGPNVYQARVMVKTYADVWVYYGDKGQDGIEYFLVVET